MVGYVLGYVLSLSPFNVLRALDLLSPDTLIAIMLTCCFFPIQSLGDRHGENLSFEEGTGGLLHVDFNCLFDKGQTFEKPEVVPFRLTHNMIDAFGAYGYNG